MSINGSVVLSSSFTSSISIKSDLNASSLKQLSHFSEQMYHLVTQEKHQHDIVNNNVLSAVTSD
jgi:hypothetical protein